MEALKTCILFFLTLFVLLLASAMAVNESEQTTKQSAHEVKVARRAAQAANRTSEAEQQRLREQGYLYTNIK